MFLLILLKQFLIYATQKDLRLARNKTTMLFLKKRVKIWCQQIATSLSDSCIEPTTWINLVLCTRDARTWMATLLLWFSLYQLLKLGLKHLMKKQRVRLIFKRANSLFHNDSWINHLKIIILIIRQITSSSSIEVLP